jgi:hypothetical protein
MHGFKVFESWNDNCTRIRTRVLKLNLQLNFLIIKNTCNLPYFSMEDATNKLHQLQWTWHGIISNSTWSLVKPKRCNLITTKCQGWKFWWITLNWWENLGWSNMACTWVMCRIRSKGKKLNPLCRGTYVDNIDIMNEMSRL